MKGIDVITIAETLVGRKYVLGSVVPADDPDYEGSFDCAEFIKYCNYQAFKILFGCDTNDLEHAHTADGYTGYFERDAKALGIMINVQDAASIPGAMILRYPAPGAEGHIVFAKGNGKTVEANSTKYGCIESYITGRRFDTGILLHGVEYDRPTQAVTAKAPAIVYRLKTPNMQDPYIAKIQKALGVSADGIFGKNTSDAVVAFQKHQGLVIDGEIAPGGQTARALGII